MKTLHLLFFAALAAFICTKANALSFSLDGSGSLASSVGTFTFGFTASDGTSSNRSAKDTLTLSDGTQINALIDFYSADCSIVHLMFWSPSYSALSMVGGFQEYWVGSFTPGSDAVSRSGKSIFYDTSVGGYTGGYEFNLNWNGTTAVGTGNWRYFDTGVGSKGLRVPESSSTLFLLGLGGLGLWAFRRFLSAQS